MTEEEADLAALLAKDVDRHFRELVEAYQQQLYRLMYRQLGSTQDTEDIVQETFLRAYYALRNYAIQGVRLQRIRPWLYKIAFNLYYNRLRVVQPHIIPLDTDDGGILCELEHPDPGPEEMVGW
ncbi:MAG: RNA polymerase sigma factor, partial [Ktedonobacteraceae bacterium]|nr:RNA polymerase sigma factor [Ktedonobacteraceae bacterium]